LVPSFTSKKGPSTTVIQEIDGPSIPSWEHWDWEAPTSIQQHLLGILPGPASVEVSEVVVETAGGTSQKNIQKVDDCRRLEYPS